MTLYARVMCVLWGCTIAAIAQNAFHHAYDVMRGETLCVGVWRVGDGDELGAQPQNVTWTPFGSLPHGIVHVVQETQFPTPATVWEGLLTGSVAATETHMMHTHRVDIQFDQLTNHHEYTYTTLLRVDEHANTPRDTNHLTVLAVQTTWSENSGWVNGHLYPGEQFGEQLLPADVDVFRVDTDAGVYCVETEANLDLTAPALQIEVYKKAAGDDAYDGEWIARTNDYNLFDDNGNVHRRRQRVYFALDNDNGAYVQISPGDSINPRTCRVRIFRARPVILIHGIECRPLGKDDVEAGRNSMLNWKTYLPFDFQSYPVGMHDFCWSSNNDDINFTEDNNIVRQIVDCDEAINPSVIKLATAYRMNVALVGHSMGGFFVRYALHDIYSRAKIYRAAVLGAPMSGSDVAHARINLLAQRAKKTSRHNLYMLRHGSACTWAMLEWGAPPSLLCIAGSGAPPRVTYDSTAGTMLGLAYDRGLRDSDGAVPVASALVEGEGSVRSLVLRRDHATVGVASYVYPNEDTYPLETSPPTWSVLWRLFCDEDNCDILWPATTVFNDEIYQAVRNHLQ